ncbi:MAG: NAD(P) transhydrogenase subunit alpha [Ichthyobacteriaceae bacterium]|nr:NAD(P) transhydrogenase subunit alpha [Ichthyobacteriaceae bacterium]
MNKLLSIGVIGKSLKENEKRVAIHPEHLDLIPDELLKQITFEEGYGENFGIKDSTLAGLTSGKVASRKEILNDFDCVLMPKPLVKDLMEIKEGAVIWGWPHCVQNEELTQIAIDKKLTLIAWEEMFTYNEQGAKKSHIFSKNNEIAGYAGVIHSLGLIGVNGSYGKARRAAIFGYGSVSRGAIKALEGQGFTDITVYKDFSSKVESEYNDISFKQLKTNSNGDMFVMNSDGSKTQLSEDLSDKQIIVNAIMQDPMNPKMFVSEQNSTKLKDGTLIVDISCDEGMGFWCSKPTTFEQPILNIAGKHYYSVDHTPSFHWNSATWEISKEILPYLQVVLGGTDEWQKNDTISKAIEIENGVIKNNHILTYQKRNNAYPHVAV